MPHSCSPHLFSRHARSPGNKSVPIALNSMYTLAPKSLSPARTPCQNLTPAQLSVQLHNMVSRSQPVLSSRVPIRPQMSPTLAMEAPFFHSLRPMCHTPNPSANSASSCSKHTKYIQSVMVPTRSCSSPEIPPDL